jgi:hypothetical protein
MEHSQLGLSEFLLVIVYKKIPEQKETEINDGLLRGKSVIFDITWHNDKEEKRYNFFRTQRKKLHSVKVNFGSFY